MISPILAFPGAGKPYRPVSHSSTPVLALDVSSGQGADLTRWISLFQPQHVIVKLAMPFEFAGLQDHSVAQLRSAVANGCTPGGYVWAYRGESPELSVKYAVDLAARAGVHIPRLWVDAEIYRSDGFNDDGPTPDWLRRAADMAARLGQPIGIYTGRWWVDGYFPGGEAAFSEFSNWPLWLSRYDQVPDLAVWNPFSGFERLAGKQFWDKPVDQSTIRWEYSE